MGASFTIVMLTDLSGDEIWTEEADGALAKVAFLVSRTPRIYW